MSFNERKSILEAIKYVNKVIDFEDDKKGSCINALEKIKKLYPDDKIFLQMVVIEIVRTYLKCLYLK